MGAYRESPSDTAGRLIVEDLESLAIPLTDEEIQKTVTVGDLFESVATKVRRTSRDRSWEIVAQIVAKRFDVDPNSISKVTRIDELGQRLNKKAK